MSITAIIVIVLVAAMMIGPIAMLQPTGRQKQVAKTRAAANAMGLQIRMDKIHGDTMALYRLPWPSVEEQSYKEKSWHFVKLDYEHDIHIAKYWSEAANKRPPQAISELISRTVGSLPESVRGLDINSGGVGLYWTEKGGESVLPELVTWLKTFRDQAMPYLCY